MGRQKTKLNLKMKRLIVHQIKKHKMKKCEIPDDVLNDGHVTPMINIPEMVDGGGKPLFITMVQFNKIHDQVARNKK